MSAVSTQQRGGHLRKPVTGRQTYDGMSECSDDRMSLGQTCYLPSGYLRAAPDILALHAKLENPPVRRPARHLCLYFTVGNHIPALRQPDMRDVLLHLLSSFFNSQLSERSSAARQTRSQAVNGSRPGAHASTPASGATRKFGRWEETEGSLC